MKIDPGTASISAMLENLVLSQFCVPIDTAGDSEDMVRCLLAASLAVRGASHLCAGLRFSSSVNTRIDVHMCMLPT